MDIRKKLRKHVNALDATKQLRDHLAPDAYVRARFDTLGGRGDAKKVADRFTADDLVAVSVLGRALSGAATIALLETERDALSELLGAIPRKQALHKADEDDLAAVAALDDALAGLPGIGPSTRTKLLARKRPTLVPLADPIVAQALTGRRSTTLTVPVRDALQDDALVDRLKEVRTEADADDLPLLRVLDIVVWMRSGGAAEG